MHRTFALLIATLLMLAADHAEAQDIVHRVAKGQNLGMIAKRYHTSAETIRKFNGLQKKHILKVGQKLRIPESAEHKRWTKFVEAKTAPKETKPPKKSGASTKKADVAPKKATKAKAKAAKATPKKAPENKWARRGQKQGYVKVVRHSDRFIGQLVASNGNVIAKSSAKLDRVLRSRRTGKRTKMDRRLFKMLASVSDHFGGRTIIVISGYRPYSKKQFTRNSRHNHGQAIDFRIVGVPNEDIYAFCRDFSQVGCGYYPNSTFVHMDVRKRKTQWTDYSKPGQAPIYARKRSTDSAGNKTRSRRAADTKRKAPKAKPSTQNRTPRKTGSKSTTRSKS